jgi:hypothetical protein
MRRRRAWAGPAGTALRYGLLVLGAAIMVLPFLDMILGALRTPAERLARPPVYWPRDPQWGNFARVFDELPMVRWLGNSLLVTSAITVLQMLTSAMAGYALAKFHFAGRLGMFRFALGAQMFPFFIFLIPWFFILRYFPLVGGNGLDGTGGSGFLGSYAALILPFAVTWYGIFLMSSSSWPSGRAPRCRAHGWGRGVLHLLPHRPSPGGFGPRHAGDLHLLLPLERGALDHDGHAHLARPPDRPGGHLPATRRLRAGRDEIAATGGDRGVDPAGRRCLPAAAEVLCR